MSGSDGDGTGAGLGSNQWQGGLGQKWAQHLEALEAQWVAAKALGLGALSPRPRERVLDIGCGGARTTRAIAEAVGAEGRVLGLDISPELVAIANDGLADLDHASVLLADASTHGFDAGGWDAVFSRFGVMFFEDPPGAFRNIHAALKPRARAVFVVHADRKGSAWASLPAGIAAEVLGPAEPTPPGAAGPFGWESPEIFVPILEAGGFGDIAWETHPVTGPMGLGLGSDPVAGALEMVRGIGVVARRLGELDEAEAALAWEEIARRLAPALSPYVEDGAVRIGGNLHVITARA
ncbi:MAG: class I SAM-dependent methyltransferase [Pseudomonadota bacterium]